MMSIGRWILVPALCLAVQAGEVRLVWHRLGDAGGATGAALDGRTVVTWGDRVRWQLIDGGKARTLAVAAIGACLADINGDGLTDLVLNERSGALAWYQAPSWTRHPIDNGVDAPDMIVAKLAGKSGLLLIHKRAQLRFYEVPADPAGSWHGRDLYSVYTPSWQGGLAIADVDGDGRDDVLFGNYWMRAPERPDQHWRLFAINTWTEQEESGMMRLAVLRGVRGMATAQRMLQDGRVAWFAKPSDPTRQWEPHELGRFDRPEGLAVADLDGDGADDIVVAEGGGAGRVILFAGPSFTPRELRRGTPAVALLPVAKGLILVTRNGIERGELAVK
jgi:hypothetical protein